MTASAPDATAASDPRAHRAGESGRRVPRAGDSGSQPHRAGDSGPQAQRAGDSGPRVSRAAEAETGNGSRRRLLGVPLLAALTVLIALAALAAGRYIVPPNEIVRLLTGQFLPVDRTWTGTEETVVLDVRLPRVLLSLLVGGGLALAGAALQGVFRNPLVSPDVIGVASGASFGGVLAMLLGTGSFGVVTGAFGFGLVALAIVMLIGRLGSGSPILMIVLGGTVTAAFFSALVSFGKYAADPESELPSIVFWLLGSLSTATYSKVVTAAIPVLLGAAVVLALRWRLNILSLGDEDATALGVPPRLTRGVFLCAVALMTAGAVAVAGLVGWVGLVVPHLARLVTGSDHRVLLPASFLIGGSYLTVIDTLSRTLTASELPLGILTAIVGAPFFIALLARSRNRMWSQ
ncbi:FecCD family ABC transporter permease [Streptomyces sp. NPDC052042]|uniref:FecCD family ABC transporter permease n=1 Tax=Streptomyces sp. NPDC052042 TaxID=3365683 RepID=UPI0037D43E8B